MPKMNPTPPPPRGSQSLFWKWGEAYVVINFGQEFNDFSLLVSVRLGSNVFLCFYPKKIKIKIKKKIVFFFLRVPSWRIRKKKKKTIVQKKKVYDFVVSGEIPFYLLVGWRGDQCELWFDWVYLCGLLSATTSIIMYIFKASKWIQIWPICTWNEWEITI